ncbi:hypothetical protein BaRGS_00022135 [Batillaria attramentaria]|uniref:Uncharacterized protein n=1 Tax=Batillaria attramentaria TaxID=370345 RepID=A0ABD0KHX1_9CAEN
MSTDTQSSSSISCVCAGFISNSLHTQLPGPSSISRTFTLPHPVLDFAENMVCCVCSDKTQQTYLFVEQDPAKLNCSEDRSTDGRGGNFARDLSRKPTALYNLSARGALKALCRY